MEVEKLLDRSDELMHYGTPRHSGRYPWGSGERPFQGDGGPKPMSEKKKLRTAKNMSRYWNQGEASEARAKTDRTIQYFRSMRSLADKRLEEDTKRLKEIENKKEKDLEDKIDIQEIKDNIKNLKEAKSMLDERIKELETPERYMEDTYRNYKHIKRRNYITGLSLAGAIGGTALMLSDEGNTEELFHDDPIGALADRADVLIHMGKAHEGNIPHSGRYPWGSGERPRQRERVHLLPANTSSGNGGVPAVSKKNYNRTASSGKIPSRSRKSRYYSGPDLGLSRSNKSRYENDAEGKKKYNKQIKFGEEAIKEAIKQAREEGKEDGELSFDDRMKLEDQYFKQVDAMGSTLESMYKHAKNLKAAKQKVKNPAKKMSDEKLKEVTDRLRLENAYLKALNESNSYTARPDKGENTIGLIRDIGKMGTTFGRMYNLNQKRLK